MDSKIFGLMLAGLVALCGVASAAYTPTYETGDMDDIFIDIIGNATVELKSDMPTLVDIGVLLLLLSGLIAVVGMVVGIFLVAPQKFRRKSVKV